MGDNDRFDRRAFLGLAGAAGLTGVTSATPGRAPGPKEGELLVGVTGTKDPEEAIGLPPQARMVHVNRTLNYAAVEFPGNGNETARENFREAMAKKSDVKYTRTTPPSSPWRSPTTPGSTTSTPTSSSTPPRRGTRPTGTAASPSPSSIRA